MLSRREAYHGEDEKQGKGKIRRHSLCRLDPLTPSFHWVTVFLESSSIMAFAASWDHMIQSANGSRWTLTDEQLTVVQGTYVFLRAYSLHLCNRFRMLMYVSRNQLHTEVYRMVINIIHVWTLTLSKKVMSDIFKSHIYFR